MKAVGEIFVGEKIQNELLLEYKETECVAPGGDVEPVALVRRHKNNAVCLYPYGSVIYPHLSSGLLEKYYLKEIGGVGPASVIILFETAAHIGVDKEVNTTFGLVEGYVLYIAFYMFRHIVFYMQS